MRSSALLLLFVIAAASATSDLGGATGNGGIPNTLQQHSSSGARSLRPLWPGRSGAGGGGDVAGELIHVDESGSDVAECGATNGTSACATLNYAVNTRAQSNADSVVVNGRLEGRLTWQISNTTAGGLQGAGPDSRLVCLDSPCIELRNGGANVGDVLLPITVQYLAVALETMDTDTRVAMDVDGSFQLTAQSVVFSGFASVVQAQTQVQSKDVVVDLTFVETIILEPVWEPLVLQTAQFLLSSLDRRSKLTVEALAYAGSFSPVIHVHNGVDTPQTGGEPQVLVDGASISIFGNLTSTDVLVPVLRLGPGSVVRGLHVDFQVGSSMPSAWAPLVQFINETQPATDNAAATCMLSDSTLSIGIEGVIPGASVLAVGCNVNLRNVSVTSPGPGVVAVGSVVQGDELSIVGSTVSLLIDTVPFDRIDSTHSVALLVTNSTFDAHQGTVLTVKPIGNGTVLVPTATLSGCQMHGDLAMGLMQGTTTIHGGVLNTTSPVSLTGDGNVGNTTLVLESVAILVAGDHSGNGVAVQCRPTNRTKVVVADDKVTLNGQPLRADDFLTCTVECTADDVCACDPACKAVPGGHGGNALSAGAKTGIAVVVIAAVLAGGFFVWRRQRTHGKTEEYTPLR